MYESPVCYLSRNLNLESEFKMKNTRILVTGGAGFIGCHLTEALLSRGSWVTVVDDLSTGRWANLDHLKGDAHLKVIIASAADSTLLEREIPRHSYVYHLASSVGVRLIMERPVQTVQNIF